jgi:hypothetical protein
MLPPKKFAKVLNVSESWLAKARKRGDGPPFYRAGRSVRYFPLPKPGRYSGQQKLVKQIALLNTSEYIRL